MRLIQRCRGFAARGALVAALVTPTVAAQAHPLVDRAAVHVERAEFDEALAFLDRAAATGALPRAEVLRLLELRALVELALGRRPEAEASLRVLATLEPDHRFPPRTSPDLVTAFELARRKATPPPRLLVEREPRHKVLGLRAHVDGDKLGLVRSTGLQVRVNGRAWRFSEGPTTEIVVAPGDRVEYTAQCRGESGVVLEAPVREYLVPGKADASTSGTSAWWYVAGGTVAAVAVVLVVALAGGGSDRTQPSPPTFEAR